MKFKRLSILLYLCLMIHLGSQNEHDSSSNLASQADQQPLKPLAFYFEFASRGFDVTTQSVFGDLSTGNLKKRIFKLDDIDDTPKLKSRRELRTRSELPKFSKDLNLTLPNHYHFNFYNNVDQDNPINSLLDPINAAFNPANYSVQFEYLSRHPNAMFEILIFVQNSYLEVTADVDEDFLKDLKKLPVVFEADTYGDFIKLYGTHYFQRADFGGLFRIRGSMSISRQFEIDEGTIKQLMKQAKIMNGDLLHTLSGGDPYDVSMYDTKYNYDKFRIYGGTNFGDEIVEKKYICEWQYKETQLTLNEWIISLNDNSVPIGGEIEPIYKLAAFENLDEKIVKNLEKATQIAIQKFKINSYLEGVNLALMTDNPELKDFLNSLNIVEFKEYFEKKLREDDPIFDKDFLEKSQRIDSLVNKWGIANVATIRDQYSCYH